MRDNHTCALSPKYAVRRLVCTKNICQYVSSVNSSHQGSRVKLKNDMLQEDQQVGRPVLQLLNAVKARALVIQCLKFRHRWKRNEKYEKKGKEKSITNQL